MNQKLGRAFKACQQDTGQDLAENIWLAICHQDRRDARIKLVSFALLAIGSIAALVPATESLLSDFTRSGFYEYLSLAFNQLASISTYWQEILYSLGETLPVMSIALALSLLLILIVSIRNAFGQMSRSQLIIRNY